MKKTLLNEIKAMNKIAGTQITKEQEIVLIRERIEELKEAKEQKPLPLKSLQIGKTYTIKDDFQSEKAEYIGIVSSDSAMYPSRADGKTYAFRQPRGGDKYYFFTVDEYDLKDQLFDK